MFCSKQNLNKYNFNIIPYSKRRILKPGQFPVSNFELGSNLTSNNKIYLLATQRGIVKVVFFFQQCIKQLEQCILWGLDEVLLLD